MFLTLLKWYHWICIGNSSKTSALVTEGDNAICLFCVNVSETLQFSPRQPVSTQLLAAALWPVSHWKLSLLVGSTNFWWASHQGSGTLRNNLALSSTQRPCVGSGGHCTGVLDDPNNLTGDTLHLGQQLRCLWTCQAESLYTGNFQLG